MILQTSSNKCGQNSSTVAPDIIYSHVYVTQCVLNSLVLLCHGAIGRKSICIYVSRLLVDDWYAFSKIEFHCSYSDASKTIIASKLLSFIINWFSKSKFISYTAGLYIEQKYCAMSFWSLQIFPQTAYYNSLVYPLNRLFYIELFTN